MKEWLKRLFLFLVIFHFIYPQALSVMGSSFIMVSGVLGLGLYISHKLPFAREISILFITYGVYLFICYTSAYVNMFYSGWEMTIGQAKSQIAWLFTAYLIIFLLFRIHTNPTPITLAYYIVCVIAFQAILTIIMHFNEDINQFLYSIELQALMEVDKQRLDGERLIGHGSYLFGGGAIFGYGLIFCSYILVKGNLKNSIQFFILAIVYALILYIGIFTARTTVVGAGVSISLVLVYYIIDYNKNKNKTISFLLSLLILIVIGYSFCLAYFPSMADWAFELFNNFVQKGELTTKSSQGLSVGLMMPDTIHGLIFGNGFADFLFSDVGYTRLAFYAGIPCLILYFLYTIVIAKLSITKDIYMNILLIMLVIYQFILNFKGLVELNHLFYLLFMFFMYYKYYKYYPTVYRQKMTMYRNENYAHNHQ